MANIDPDMLAGSLRRLGRSTEHDLVGVLEEAVRACVALFRVDGSGLMVADEQNTLTYLAASDGPSHVMEEAQSSAGEGPCVSAFVGDTTVRADDLRSDTRWPLVTGTFLDQGIVSVLGCPLRLGGVPVGTIDVYRHRPHEWDDSERDALLRYTEVVETMLAAAMAAHRAGEIADQLQYALDYRVVIERAVGYLMAQRGLDAVAAFNLLRRSARDGRRKIGDAAQQVLDTGTL